MDLSRLRRIGLVIIGLLVLLASSLFIFNRNRVYLRTGDILVYDHSAIYLLNSSNNTLVPIIDLSTEQLSIGWGVYVSPKHDFIYMTASRWTTPEQYQLIRYRLSDGSIQTVADISGLAGISPISTDGQRMILFIGSQEQPASAYYCLLEISTGDCIPLVETLNLHTLIWFDESTLIDISFDSIDEFHINAGKLILNRSIEASNLTFHASDFASDGRLIIAVVQRTTEGLFSMLYGLDLSRFELSIIPVTLADYNAAFNSLLVAPTGKYVMFQRGHRLEVLDLENENTVTQLDEVYYSAWIPKSEKLLVFYDPDPKQPYSDELAILDVSTQQIQTISKPDHQMYIVSVP